MKAQIFLTGLTGIDKLEKIEIIDTDMAGLKDRLYKLQSGYCEGEKPKFRNTEQWVSKKGNKLVGVECYSHSDYSYLAIYKVL
jgi:3-phenylpropionate/cinnamic acid dioxygenase small subunit